MKHTDNRSLSLCIIIVNWNAGNQLKDCLLSIAKCKKDNFILDKVVVVDNASTDKSLDEIENIMDNLVVIRNDENLGFAKACNRGAKLCDSDYLLFLNPDAKLFKDTLSIAVDFLNKSDNKKIGILGVQLIDENGNVSRTCSRFPTITNLIAKSIGLSIFIPKLDHFMREWDHKDNKYVDHVIGAHFIVKKELFDKLHGFDERFFLYLEDLDFSLRAKQLGYYSYYLAEAQAYHKGGGTSEQIKAKRLFYSIRSSILYSYKHFSFFQATIVTFFRLFVEPLSRSLYALMKRDLKTLQETWVGYIFLYKNIPNMLKSKKK